jgi:hypothetical protein
MSKTCGILGLGKNCCKSIEEKIYVSNPSELRPKSFDFCIEGFCRSICASVVEVIKDVLVMD